MVTVNGTVKKIFASVLVAVAIFLTTQYLVDTRRIATLEAQVSAIQASLSSIRTETERNRVENREEHAEIQRRLNLIITEVRK